MHFYGYARRVRAGAFTSFLLLLLFFVMQFENQVHFISFSFEKKMRPFKLTLVDLFFFTFSLTLVSWLQYCGGKFEKILKRIQTYIKNLNIEL